MSWTHQHEAGFGYAENGQTRQQRETDSVSHMAKVLDKEVSATAMTILRKSRAEDTLECANLRIVASVPSHSSRAVNSQDEY